MIQHYGLWNRPDRAEELFLEMKTRNIHPNEDTYVALIGALTRVRRGNVCESNDWVGFWMFVNVNCHLEVFGFVPLFLPKLCSIQNRNRERNQSGFEFELE